MIDDDDDYDDDDDDDGILYLPADESESELLETFGLCSLPLVLFFPVSPNG